MSHKANMLGNSQNLGIQKYWSTLKVEKYFTEDEHTLQLFLSSVYKQQVPLPKKNIKTKIKKKSQKKFKIPILLGSSWLKIFSWKIVIDLNCYFDFDKLSSTDKINFTFKLIKMLYCFSIFSFKRIYINVNNYFFISKKIFSKSNFSSTLLIDHQVFKYQKNRFFERSYGSFIVSFFFFDSSLLSRTVSQELFILRKGHKKFINYLKLLVLFCKNQLCGNTKIFLFNKIKVVKTVRAFRMRISGKLTLGGRHIPKRKRLWLSFGKVSFGSHSQETNYGSSYAITRYGIVNIKVWLNSNRGDKDYEFFFNSFSSFKNLNESIFSADGTQKKQNYCVVNKVYINEQSRKILRLFKYKTIKFFLRLRDRSAGLSLVQNTDRWGNKKRLLKLTNFFWWDNLAFAMPGVNTNKLSIGLIVNGTALNSFNLTKNAFRSTLAFNKSCSILNNYCYSLINLYLNSLTVDTISRYLLYNSYSAVIVLYRKIILSNLLNELDAFYNKGKVFFYFKFGSKSIRSFNLLVPLKQAIKKTNAFVRDGYTPKKYKFNGQFRSRLVPRWDSWIRRKLFRLRVAHKLKIKNFQKKKISFFSWRYRRLNAKILKLLSRGRQLNYRLYSEKFRGYSSRVHLKVLFKNWVKRNDGVKNLFKSYLKIKKFNLQRCILTGRYNYTDQIFLNKKRQISKWKNIHGLRNIVRKSGRVWFGESSRIFFKSFKIIDRRERGCFKVKFLTQKVNTLVTVRKNKSFFNKVKSNINFLQVQALSRKYPSRSVFQRFELVSTKQNWVEIWKDEETKFFNFELDTPHRQLELVIIPRSKLSLENRENIAKYSHYRLFRQGDYRLFTVDSTVQHNDPLYIRKNILLHLQVYRKKRKTTRYNPANYPATSLITKKEDSFELEKIKDRFFFGFHYKFKNSKLAVNNNNRQSIAGENTSSSDYDRHYIPIRGLNWLCF